MLRGALLQDLGFDHRRRDAVDADVVFRALLAEGFGEADDARSQRAVARGVGVAPRAREAGAADDAAISVLEQLRDHRAAAEEDAGESDVDALAPHFRGQLPGLRIPAAY